MKTFRIEICCDSLLDLKDIVAKRLCDRGLTESQNAQFTIKVTLDNNFRKDSYRITGKPQNIHITADSLINAYAGCGAFLYNSQFNENGIIPSKKRGVTTPDCPHREVYTAAHFHSFYETAPLDEYFTYLEDMALMGINILTISFSGQWLNGKGKDKLSLALERTAAIGKKAMSLGMKLSCGASTSTTFLNIPNEARAEDLRVSYRRGNAGYKVCPSKPEGLKLLEETNRIVLSTWKKYGLDISYAGFFPYDEGGCGCDDCDPWGANGYIRACKNAKKIVLEYFPNCKFVVGTWLFDSQYDQGEWSGLKKSLDEEKWCDIVMADSHTEFPRFPLDVGVPGNLPLIAFPEISMWGLWPWGGYGASFFPKRYTSIWRKTEGILSGGRMYSEGIYEDLNKYTVAGLYRDFNTNPDDTIRQYGNYHFGCPDIEKFVELINLIETNTVLNSETPGLKVFLTPENNKANLNLAKRAFALAQEIDASLPDWGKKSWRWRLIYIRAFIDLHRYQNEKLHENPEACVFMCEIMDIYHCIKDYKIKDDPSHAKLRPPFPIYDEDFDLNDYPGLSSLKTAFNSGIIITDKNRISKAINDDAEATGA